MFNWLFIVISILSTYQLVLSKSFDANDCFVARDEPNSLLCRSIPDCSKPITIFNYRKYKTIIFDLENLNGLRSRAFYNCSFDFSLTFQFKNIQRVSSYAFDSISVTRSHILNIKFDGSTLNLDKSQSQSRLIINRHAFNNIVLSPMSKLDIFVKNYERAYIRDTLVENMLWQGENSEININVNNVDLVWFKNKRGELVLFDGDKVDDKNGFGELDISDEKPVNLKEDSGHFTANNLSYSLLVNNANQVVFDAYVFANLQVNPYSDFNVVVQVAKSVFVNASLFDSLMLGFYSR